MEQQVQTNPRLNFNKIFEYCLLALVFLTPLIFAPSILVSLYSSKLAFLVTVIVGIDDYWVGLQKGNKLKKLDRR